GFLPADDPKLSIIVVIDEPRTTPYAATVAAPAFAEIGRYAARSVGVAPSAGEPAAPLAIGADDDRVRATPAAPPTPPPPPGPDRAGPAAASPGDPAPGG